jgi:hypothetical protein
VQITYQTSLLATSIMGHYLMMTPGWPLTLTLSSSKVLKMALAHTRNSYTFQLSDQV